MFLLFLYKARYPESWGGRQARSFFPIFPMFCSLCGVLYPLTNLFHGSLSMFVRKLSWTDHYSRAHNLPIRKSALSQTSLNNPSGSAFLSPGPTTKRTICSYVYCFPVSNSSYLSTPFMPCILRT